MEADEQLQGFIEDLKYLYGDARHKTALMNLITSFVSLFNLS